MKSERLNSLAHSANKESQIKSGQRVSTSDLGCSIKQRFSQLKLRKETWMHVIDLNYFKTCDDEYTTQRKGSTGVQKSEWSSSKYTPDNGALPRAPKKAPACKTETTFDETALFLAVFLVPSGLRRWKCCWK
jgi:hypothetical protein